MATKRRGPFKGCCALCATNKGKWRRCKHSDPHPVLRRLLGRRRRIKRHHQPPEEDEC